RLAPEAYQNAILAGIDTVIISDRFTELGLESGWPPDLTQALAADAIAAAKQTMAAGGNLSARENLNGTAHWRPASSPPARPPAVLRFTKVEEIVAMPVDWLWPGRLARKKLTLISGDPGLGKSQLTTDVAARVSTNGTWPDGGEAPSGSIIILSAEDT